MRYRSSGKKGNPWRSWVLDESAFFGSQKSPLSRNYFDCETPGFSRTKDDDESESFALPTEGIEPTLTCVNWILSPARLPVPPRRLF